jgi:hypothetical protein
MKIERFEDLEIWQEARELCKVGFEIIQIDILSSSLARNYVVAGGRTGSNFFLDKKVSKKSRLQNNFLQFYG